MSAFANYTHLRKHVGRPGCVLEKLFQRVPPPEPDLLKTRPTDSVYALRTSFVPLLRFLDIGSGRAMAWRASVDREHFKGSCDDNKRKRCPLDICLRHLIRERSDLAFVLFDSIIESYKAWLVDKWMNGTSELALEMLNAIEQKELNVLSAGLGSVAALVSDAMETREVMRAIFGGVEAMLLQDKEVPKEFAELWSERLESGEDILHDGNHISAGSVSVMESLPYFIEVGDLEGIKDFLYRVSKANPRRVDALIQMAANFNNKMAIAKEVKIEVGKLLDLEVAEGVRFLLFRMLNELVTNSIKYCYDGTDRERYVKVGAVQNGDLVEFFVEDNGIGIENVEYALERGAQERPALVKKGQGIGLSSVKRISDEQGWEFNIVSVPGRGTKVTLGIESEVISTRAQQTVYSPRGKSLVSVNELPRERRILSSIPPPADPFSLLWVPKSMTRPVNVIPASILAGAHVYLFFPAALQC